MLETALEEQSLRGGGVCTGTSVVALKPLCAPSPLHPALFPLPPYFPPYFPLIDVTQGGGVAEVTLSLCVGVEPRDP